MAVELLNRLASGPPSSTLVSAVSIIDGVGCTLPVGRKVKKANPAKSFEKENHREWPS
jgi:hypothetical protein